MKKKPATTDIAGHDEQMMTTGGHLEVLRQMLFRIIGVTTIITIVVFCFKETTFYLLLAPSSSDFTTYRAIEHICRTAGMNFQFEAYCVELINTELSNQFMTHISASVCLALLLASPYIVVELFKFVTPALYENERKYSITIVITAYLLFILGVLMSYFVIFPFAVRFLGTYQVTARVVNQITLSSYISTFTILTFMMGIVFQIPIIAFFLVKMGLLEPELMTHYRKHALIVIMLIAAIITPPDLFTLVMVTIPMCLLYEASIKIVKLNYKKK